MTDSGSGSSPYQRLAFADVLARAYDDPTPSSSANIIVSCHEEDCDTSSRCGLASEMGKSRTTQLNTADLLESRAERSPPRRKRKSRWLYPGVMSAAAILGLTLGVGSVNAILAPGDDPEPVANLSATIAITSPDASLLQPPPEPTPQETLATAAQISADVLPDPIHTQVPVEVPLQEVHTPASTAILPDSSTESSSYSASLVAREPPSQAVFEAVTSFVPPYSPTSASTLAPTSSSASATTTLQAVETSESKTSATESIVPAAIVSDPVVPTESTSHAPADSEARTSNQSPGSAPMSAESPSSSPVASVDSATHVDPTETSSTETPTQTSSSEPSSSASQATEIPASTQATASPSATAPAPITNSKPAEGNPAPLLAQLKHRWNFASADCAAVVHRTNPGTKFASSILNEKKDRYMLSPCTRSPTKNEDQGQFVILELCDDIMIDTVVLGNYEFFSSQFKRFRLRAAAKLHAREEEWYDFGTFRARNSRGLQVFVVDSKNEEGEGVSTSTTGDIIPGYDGEDGPGSGSGTGNAETDGNANTAPPPPASSTRKDARFFRYVRIDFLEHYGSEFYCPLSVLRVYGMTALDEFYSDQEANAAGKGGAGSVAVPPSMSDPIVATVVELADQLDFAYQYAANGWGHPPGHFSKELNDDRLIGDGSTISDKLPGEGSIGRDDHILSPFDDMEDMLNAAAAAVRPSSAPAPPPSNHAASILQSNRPHHQAAVQWKKEQEAASHASAAAAAAALSRSEEDAETYRIDVNAGQPHIHVNIPGAGSALGADPVVMLTPAKTTCAPGEEAAAEQGQSDLNDAAQLADTSTSNAGAASDTVTGQSTHVSSASVSSEMIPQPRSTVQVDLPPATSIKITSTPLVTTDGVPVAEVPVSSSIAKEPVSHSPVASSTGTAGQNVTSSELPKTASGSANPVVKPSEQVNATVPVVADRAVPPSAQSAVIPPGQDAASVKMANGTASGTAPSASSVKSSNNAASRSASSASASSSAPVVPSSSANAEPPHRPPTPPPPSGGGAGTESIYRAINKRLSALEYNSTLNLAFIEHSQRLLRDGFTTMAERHQARIDEMVRLLNASNWRQFDLLRRRTQVDLQRALFESEMRRQQADSERSAMISQIHLLTEEVPMQKRISLIQLVLIFGLFVFVTLTRGIRAPLIQTSLGSRFGVSSRPSTPNPTGAGGAPSASDSAAASTTGFGLLPPGSFLRQRLNRSRRVSAPTTSTAPANGPASAHGGAPHAAHQPTDRSRLSIVMPSQSHPGNVYRLNSGASSPNGSILELNEVPPQSQHRGIIGENWRERMRSNGTGSVVSFLEDHFSDLNEEDFEGLDGEDADASSGSRADNSKGVSEAVRRRSTSTTTSATSASVRSGGSDTKSVTFVAGHNGPVTASHKSVPHAPPPFSVKKEEDEDTRDAAFLRSNSMNGGGFTSVMSHKNRKKKRGSSLLGKLGNGNTQGGGGGSSPGTI